MSEGGEFAMWLAAGSAFVGITIVLTPIFKAIAHRISHGYDGKGQLADVEARFAELEARLAAVEDKGPRTDEVVIPAERLRELEERVDFTERVLARGDEPRPGGGGTT